MVRIVQHERKLGNKLIHDSGGNICYVPKAAIS